MTSTIAVLGSGAVARRLAPRLRAAGHRVTIGSRTPGPGVTGHHEACLGADVVICAVPGAAAPALLRTLPLAGTVLIDVANAVTVGPDGFAAALLHPDRSLAEHLQDALPDTFVVKALNTMHVSAMAGDGATATAFVAGDYPDANGRATALLRDVGWPEERILDVGPLAAARWLEGFALAIRPIVTAFGPVPFGLSVAR